MWYRDPFLIYLTGLLAILLCRHVTLFFKEGGFKGRADFCPILSCMVACFSLFSVNSFFQVFWLGLYLAFINWRHSRMPSLPYCIMVLLLFGLYPSFWSMCLILPVLFWTREGISTSYILSVGYAFKNSAGDPFFYFLGIISLALLVILWSLYKQSEGGFSFLMQFCALTRSLLLVGLLQIAQQIPLYDCAQAALCALLLDVTCQVLASLNGQWRSFCLAFPLLPGFAILWFSLHAALLLAGPHTSWTLLGLVLGIVIGLLSIFETIIIIVSLPSVHIEGSFMMTAALITGLLPIIAFFIAPREEGLMFLHYDNIGQWVQLWCESENGRAFLWQSCLWLLWGFIWFACITPRMTFRKPAVFLSCPVSAKMKLEEKCHLSIPHSLKPNRSLRWQARLLMRECSSIRQSLGEWWEGQPDISLFIWLSALAILFLMIGLSS